MTARFVPPSKSAPLPEEMRPSGRGAVSNASGRYESEAREPFDDGWDSGDREPSSISFLVSSGSIVDASDDARL